MSVCGEIEVMVTSGSGMPKNRKTHKEAHNMFCHALAPDLRQSWSKALALILGPDPPNPGSTTGKVKSNLTRTKGKVAGNSRLGEARMSWPRLLASRFGNFSARSCRNKTEKTNIRYLNEFQCLAKLSQWKRIRMEFTRSWNNYGQPFLFGKMFPKVLDTSSALNHGIGKCNQTLGTFDLFKDFEWMDTYGTFCQDRNSSQAAKIVLRRSYTQVSDTLNCPWIEIHREEP